MAGHVSFCFILDLRQHIYRTMNGELNFGYMRPVSRGGGPLAEAGDRAAGVVFNRLHIQQRSLQQRRRQLCTLWPLHPCRLPVGLAVRPFLHPYAAVLIHCLVAPPMTQATFCTLGARSASVERPRVYHNSVSVRVACKGVCAEEECALSGGLKIGSG